MPYIAGAPGGTTRIQPPFYRGYILLETVNGKTYKYVRNQVRPAIGLSWLSGGDSGMYYSWGDTRCGYNAPFSGDSYINTGDTIGRIKYDFDRLSNTWQILLRGGDSTLMRFPEFGGDTITLSRSNKEQSNPINIPGDTYSYRFYKITPYTRLRLRANQIVSITAIEERMPMWYQAANRTYMT
jgi:hypothetical protein